MMHKNTILAILLIASPILFVFVVYSDTFSMSWNQGRGGFLFGLAFIVAEIVGIKFVVSKNRLIFGIPLVIATVLYFVSLDFGLHDYILNVSEYAINTNKIGLAINSIASIVFLCIIVNSKKFNKYAIQKNRFNTTKKNQKLIFALTS